jgi:hypothetical protein
MQFSNVSRIILFSGERQVLNNMIEGVSVQLPVGYRGRTALHHV